MKSLNTIGISEKEQQIYVVLLDSGITSVSELSLLTKVKRTTLYSNLEQLKKKGLVSEITSQNKKYFQALNPRGLKKVVKDRIGELKKLEKDIPKLLDKYKSAKKKTRKSSARPR